MYDQSSSTDNTDVRNPLLDEQTRTNANGTQVTGDVVIDSERNATPEIIDDDILEDAAWYAFRLLFGDVENEDATENDSNLQEIVVHQANRQRTKKTYSQQLWFYTKVFGAQSWFSASAVQSAMNTGAVTSTLTGHECKASQLDCFTLWRGPMSLLVYFDMFCAWYANYRTMLEYFPTTFKKVWDIFVKGEFSWLRIFALFSGATGGLISFVLNLESSAALAAKWGTAGYVFGVFTLIAGVVSAFSTRFIGSEVMLTIIYERLLACLFADYLYDYLGKTEKAKFYHDRRQLIVALSYIYTYEYYISSDVLTEFCDKMSNYKRIIHLSSDADVPQEFDAFDIYVQKTGEELTAYWCVDGARQYKVIALSGLDKFMSLLPLPTHGSEDPALIQSVTSKFGIFRPRYQKAFSLLFHGLETEGEWSGLLQEVKPSYSGKASYALVLLELFFICICSYVISYNITLQAFPTLKDWPKISYLSALPNTFFYMYSFLFLPDQVARSFSLSQHSSSWMRWAGFAAAFLIALFSCLNLVYTASSQADAGDYDAIARFFHIAPAILKIFFMFIAGNLSGLCNLLPILKIDEKYADKKHFDQSQKMLADINHFITRADRPDDQTAVAGMVKNSCENYQPSWCSSCFYSRGLSYMPLPLSGELAASDSSLPASEELAMREDDNMGSEADVDANVSNPIFTPKRVGRFV